MRFDKLNDDKIRITLSHDDLVKKDIDFHSFMSNSLESQDLFFDMLEEAEKEIGFVTKDYLIRIEALAMAGGDFIITVTRTMPNVQKNNTKKKLSIKRKQPSLNNKGAIYSFVSFDDFCSFINYFKANNFKLTGLAERILLYEYNDLYYLVLNNINFTYPDFKKLFSGITEFATSINYTNVFESKLSESANLIMKNNAIRTAIKHF